MVRRVMIIAGEASGDLHGSGVVRELKRRSPGIDVYGVGGSNMKREGMDLIYHIQELGFMGFWEVLRHLPFIKAMEHTLEQIVKFKTPDILVLIDYPGFNLRFAQIAKRYDVKIVYYISPQVWAWHKKRVDKIRSRVDKMLVIFPFELDFYRGEGIDAEFVGHPMLEELESRLDRKNFCKRFSLDEQKPIVALIPGSRRQEIDDIFPEMLSAARLISSQVNAEIVVAVAPTLEEEYFKTLYNVSGIHLVKGLTYEIMANADFALVTSGTATLETACFGTPMLVVYKTSWLTYILGRALVHVKNIGLVNIVAGKEIVPEFIQHRATAKPMAATAMRLLTDVEQRSLMKAELSTMKSRLGDAGASQRVAERVLQMK